MYKKIIFLLLSGIIVSGIGCGSSSKSGSSGNNVQPPQAPANLMAIPEDRQISLTWSPSTGANGYNIYPQDTSKNVQNAIPTTVTTTTYTYNNLSNGALYEYYVEAYNSAGISNQKSETMAIPSFITATTVTQGINLTWSTVTHPTVPTYYTVFYNSNTPSNQITSTSASYTFTGLTPKTVYDFTVTVNIPGYPQNIPVGAAITATIP